MTPEPTVPLQSCIDRLKTGDTSARDELIRHSCEQMRQLVGKIMRKYDRLQRWVDIDDVLQNAVVRLLHAMDSVPIDSVQSYFSLAALQIRRELLDLCRHYFGPHGLGANHESANVMDSGEGDPRPVHRPAAAEDTLADQYDLSFWSDFHEVMETLPPGERNLFDLIWYHGMTQAEAALVLNLSEAKVKRLWAAARERMKKLLGKDIAE
jgi:RNA polymerase sigma factor (sigma-70 family)